MDIKNNVLETIGNTPLIRLNKITKDVNATVCVKYEATNPGNSIKDRMAVKMIEDAEKAGLLKPGGTIVEGTSGNTGMGLALAAIVKGYKCIFTTTDKQSKEKVDILKAVGADVIVCPTNVESTDPRSYYSVARRIAEETPNSIYVNQYDNLSNRLAHYETTGPEIWEQTDGKITHLVVGVGTGGTISGVGKFLKEKNPNIKIWGIDTYGSVLKKYHETREFDEKEIYSYITEGIGEDIIPKNIDFSVIDHMEKVTDKDGAVYARKLAKEEGIFSGYSAGSAIAGLLQLKDRLAPNDLVVVILHDHGSRYVGKVYNDEWMRERKFLEDTGLTAERIIDAKKLKKFITIHANESISKAFEQMKTDHLSQLPVLDEKGEIVGMITEHSIMDALLNKKLEGESAVSEVMNKDLKTVDLKAGIQEISSKISKENPAVLVKNQVGICNIITEYDLIEQMAKS